MSAVEQLRGLGRRSSETDLTKTKKQDKLEQTKKREAEVKAIFKGQRDAQRHHKQEEHHAESVAYRLERSWNTEHPSKRAEHDLRVAKKHDRRAEHHFVCEHGVHNCRICRPVATHK